MDSAHANQGKEQRVLRLYRYETEQVEGGHEGGLAVCPRTEFEMESRAVVVRRI